MRFVPTAAFVKALSKLGPDQRQLAEERLKALYLDPRKGSLHFKPLKGTPYFSARIDGNFRIVLRKAGESFELVDACSHDTYDRRYGKNKV